MNSALWLADFVIQKSYAVTRDHYDHTIDIVYISNFIDLLERMNHFIPRV